MPLFGPVITAMITPFTSNGAELDFVATEKIVEHLVRNGSDAIVVSGTTGESPTLTHDEEVELFKVVQAKVKSLKASTKLIFGAGSNSTQTAIAMSKEAERLGADGLLIVTPYYNKPNQEGLKEHYSLIARATSLPIILYNVPGRCVIALQAQTIIELVNLHSNIVALKEASNNIDLITKIKLGLGSKAFEIYSGDDSLTLPMLAVGADGVISVASHLLGNEMQEMIKEFKAGNLPRAIKIHQDIFPVFDALFVEPNPTCIKEAMSMLGFCSASLRSPLVPLKPEQRASLRTCLEKIVNSIVKQGIMS